MFAKKQNSYDQLANPHVAGSILLMGEHNSEYCRNSNPQLRKKQHIFKLLQK